MEAGMNELIFLVEAAAEGGYVARALGASIFTEADSVEELHAQVRDAVECHFEPERRPKIIRLLASGRWRASWETSRTTSEYAGTTC